MLDAVAAASGIALADIRRAVMLRGATGPVAVAALTEGADAVRAFGLEVGQPIRPMLASTAPDVAAAFDKLATAATRSCVDTKLDGIRVQVHKAGDQVWRVHPQPRRRHRPADRRGGGGSRRCRSSRRSSTARRSRWTTTGGRGRSRRPPR